tara:strand:- start:318 stop:512 length:195 start_codon:yes stop_codon:yes gene_type:complete
MNTFYFILRPFKFFKLFWRASGRLGLFAKYIRAGYSENEARSISDELAPPSKEQIQFERWWNKK